jgi:hypothetical protein
MFDMNSLKKLTDEVPEDIKEKLKDSAMEKLGFSSSDSGKSSEEASVPSAQVDQAQQADAPPDVQGNDSGQPESIGEDKADAA